MELFLLTPRRIKGTIKRSESDRGSFTTSGLSKEKELTVPMNNVASPFNVVMQDVSLAHRDVINRRLAGATPVLSEEIIHELRQPLGVIDSLAYYLELTAADEKMCAHLEKIRAMVSQANGILERISNASPEMPLGNPFISGS